MGSSSQAIAGRAAARRKPAPVLLLALGLATALETPARASEEAWSALASLRSQVERNSPLLADFEQTFVAAGFSSGESEIGRISMDLPECVRWDYAGDFPKTYLLCGRVAYAWNEGEPSGRRQFLGPEEEPGLELLRLEIAELRLRYRARLAADARQTRIELTALAEAANDSGGAPPTAPNGGIRDATVAISPDGSRLESLSYHDLEGNLTRFVFSEYRPLEPREVFEPPKDLEWIQ